MTFIRAYGMLMTCILFMTLCETEMGQIRGRQDETMPSKQTKPSKLDHIHRFGSSLAPTQPLANNTHCLRLRATNQHPNNTHC